MSIFDYQMRKVPDYYPTMYLDGFKPEEIMFALKRKMFQEQEDRQPEPPTEIHITVENKKK